MAIERHPFQFFLAGIADKLKGEDMAITFLHMDEDGYLDKTVSEIIEAAENNIIILKFADPDSESFGNYYFTALNDTGEGYYLCFFGFVGDNPGSNSNLVGYLFYSAELNDYPQIYD